MLNCSSFLGKEYIILPFHKYTLEQEIARNPKRHSLSQKIMWAVHLCEGMEFVHGSGIMHRGKEIPT